MTKQSGINSQGSEKHPLRTKYSPKWQVAIFLILNFIISHEFIKSLSEGSASNPKDSQPEIEQHPPAIEEEDFITSGRALLRKLIKRLIITLIISAIIFVHLRYNLTHVLGGFWNFIAFEYPERLLVPTAAFIAAVVALAGFWQKRGADRKAEWWKRTQYAMDNLTSGRDETVSVGILMIEHLAKEQSGSWFGSSLADRQDKNLFASVTLRVAQDIEKSRTNDKMVGH